MNGTELAKEFRSHASASEIFDWCHKAQAMLCQQQAEIEALKTKTLTDTQIRKLYLYAFTDGELKHKRPYSTEFIAWAKEKMTEEL